jgi:xylose isomerase
VIGFLKHYQLDKDYKLNIEANHAFLAGHTFEHELATASSHGMLVREGEIERGESETERETERQRESEGGERRNR